MFYYFRIRRVIFAFFTYNFSEEEITLLITIKLFSHLHITLFNTHILMNVGRSQQPRGLRRRSASTCLLRLWVRISPGAWTFVCRKCCVLSGRGLCDELIIRPEESYRLWCVIVCDLQTSNMRRSWPDLGRSVRAGKNNEINVEHLKYSSSYHVMSSFLVIGKMTFTKYYLSCPSAKCSKMTVLSCKISSLKSSYSFV
jgi:hypothetical protein